MNYYLKRRLQSGLTKSDMANELGLSYIRYSAIERGDVKMPSNLINKFNEIINRGKENEIKKTESEIKADEFWREVSQLNENNVYVLQDKMKEFNIPSLKVLVKLLGYKSVGTIYNYLEGRNPVGVEFKKRLYNFFSNELNIQMPTEVETAKEKTHTKRQVSAANEKLDRYYAKTDFKKIMKAYQLTNTQIAAVVGVHGSVISRMTSKSGKPSYKVIQGVKDYLDSITNNTNVEEIEEGKNRTFAYKHSQRALDFFNSFNLINWLEQQELTTAKFARMCGLSEATLYNFDSYKKVGRVPMNKTINTIKQAVEEYESKKTTIPEEKPTQYISKQKLIEECQKEIDINNAKIEELTNQIKELQFKNELSIKFIALVNTLQ